MPFFRVSYLGEREDSPLVVWGIDDPPFYNLITIDAIATSHW